jgi:hypothetical protein
MKYTFLSESHLGDCMLHAHFMRKCVEQNPNIKFDFHLIGKHWDQTKEYIDDIPQIKCLPYEDAPFNSLRGWVGQFGIPPLPCPLDGLRLFSYKKLSQKMGITCPYKDEYDILYDHPKIKNGYETPEFDVLLVNSIPFSNQIEYKETDYLNFVDKVIRKGKTIITTYKIEGVPCTTDFNLSVMGIGNLATKCKIIAGIGTGAMQCCLNVWTKDKRFFYIDKHHTFNMKHIKMIDNISVLEP